MEEKELNERRKVARKEKRYIKKKRLHRRERIIEKSRNSIIE